MGSDLLSSNGILGGYDSIQEDGVYHHGREFLENITSLPTENSLIEDHNQQQEPDFDFFKLQEFPFDSDMQPTRPFPETRRLKSKEVANSELAQYDNKPSPTSSILKSLELLSNYGNRLKRLMEQNISKPIPISSEGRHKLSTQEIIRLAGERYVQFSTHWDDTMCIPMHPYGFDLGLGGLSEEENRDVEFVQFLLTAAEKVGCEQFERASKLVLHCQLNSSACASPVQKVISSFAQALGERIAKETGIITTLKESEKNKEQELIKKMDFNVALMYHKKIPFHQMMQFTGIQAIVENVVSETKIHVIDLAIACGMQWTALMQTLAERRERPIQLLKITAIGFRGKDKLEETGENLVCFAESLNLPFWYKAVFVTDMMEMKEDRFEIDDDEVVAVYAPYVLRTMVSRPECLENLMRILRNIKPCIMIVLEVEAKHNSSSFVNRFVEALFYFSAFMDCIETCIEENECKVTFEAILGESLRNIVAMEGKERTVRHVKIDVWRRFFASLDKNGRSLTVGWKGTPINSLSAWKFL
ncbi:DELLA protein RGL1-like [Senna tora]|uniref:DELLA protein RGL1-like n=1 Tax=Senna tora TaxID=362788 RepID=A0A834SJT1_9FABA|nr:DELLA protein RGL1-like [Senna tora]